MDLYYAIIDTDVVGLTWADNDERALSQIEFALAEEGIFDTSQLHVLRYPRNEVSLIFNLQEQ
jgi:hypothetical protein